MEKPLVVCDYAPPIAKLTLNSPDNFNALSEAMVDSLTKVLGEIGDRRDIKAVLLTGAGKGFCAGHDLRELDAARRDHEDGGREFFVQLFNKSAEMMIRIMKLPQPVIALPHGVAAAAGCQLVATCDLAVAASDTQFGVNGVNIGLFCSTPMVAMSRTMQRKPLMEMLLTGEFIDGERAREVGLINRVVPADRLSAEGLELATLIASKSDSVISVGKEAFYAQAELPLAAAYEYTAEIMAENMMLQETSASIHAFAAKPKN
ncbi:enoyl-CoA hydratase [Algicella marina]|uniref:Enoyl-CoA hydratase domain-containing protein 3, mitochondrial n=1 Tax=Algicella marina TaxID=2683284 RepID=A0A6P1SW17_9RHOB|nr:enoyl-CoA hydratase [Algicella marina]QHQ34864.1 enoyl-CoA hydratase [Algicella marina]